VCDTTHLATLPLFGGAVGRGLGPAFFVVLLLA